MNKKSLALQISKEVVNYFNEINFNMFTTEEIEEGIKENMYMLENEKSTLLNLLNEELNNFKSKEIKSLITKVLAF